MWFVLGNKQGARPGAHVERAQSPPKTPNASAEGAHLARGALSPYGKVLRRRGLGLKMTAKKRLWTATARGPLA